MNRVTVKIANTEYTITGEQKREYILQVASHVDEKLDELRSANPKLSPTMAAVLTAVNIAEEYFSEVRRNSEMDRVMREPVKELENIRNRVTELEKVIILKDEEIKGFDKKIEDVRQEILEKDKEREEVEQRLAEKDVKLKEAEELVNDSQNRLFDLQLRIIELEEQLQGNIHKQDGESNE